MEVIVSGTGLVRPHRPSRHAAPGRPSALHRRQRRCQVLRQTRRTHPIKSESLRLSAQRSLATGGSRCDQRQRSVLDAPACGIDVVALNLRRARLARPEMRRGDRQRAHRRTIATPPKAIAGFARAAFSAPRLHRESKLRAVVEEVGDDNALASVAGRADGSSEASGVHQSIVGQGVCRSRRELAISSHAYGSGRAIAGGLDAQELRVGPDEQTAKLGGL